MSDAPQVLSGEDRLIARYFRPLARAPGAFGLSDDAAILEPPPGWDVVLKTDPIIAGVHFFPDDPPDAVARKALRVNLSDLAAKGATPAGFLLALALPPTISEDWLAPFAGALGEDADRYQCPLLGGDTDATPGLLTVSITAFGLVPHGTMVPRNGAKVGDHVVVSGTVGDAALGLRLRRAAPGSPAPPARVRDHLLSRYQIPEPRTGLAETLRRYASAAMDISDGLAGDLAKLCRASGVSAQIDIAQLPLSAAARSMLDADPALLDVVLTGGDDYEVLCTLPSAHLVDFRDAATATGIAVTIIGQVVAGPADPRFSDARGQLRSFGRPSFSHF
ncbi:MAG TPA: thiamine-phosphate kinase [Xanthobacteraceae bacterium]|nr:thiamine-phosphate kinase [Xanthobacteraceae bacterium]